MTRADQMPIVLFMLFVSMLGFVVTEISFPRVTTQQERYTVERIL